MEGIQPAISVIMPVYNAADYLRESIQSILVQTFEDFELLIIDDGSQDDSLAIINSFSDFRIRVFQNTENLGYLKTVNSAFTQCRGQYITFQDADDSSAPNRFEVLLSELKSDEGTVLCGSQCYFVKGAKRSVSNYPLSYSDIIKAIEGGDSALFCGASIMFRKQIIDIIGGYRELYDRIGSEHVDWFLRVVGKYGVKNIEEPLYYYNHNPASISKSYSLNPLRYHSAEIAMALYRQRVDDGLDVLEKDQISIDHFLDIIQEPYKKDPALIYLRAGITQLSFENYRSFFDCGKKYYAKSGFNVGIIKYYFCLVPFIFINRLSERNKKKMYRYIKKMTRG